MGEGACCRLVWKLAYGTNPCFRHILGLNRPMVHANKQFSWFDDSDGVNKQNEFEKVPV